MRRLSATLLVPLVLHLCGAYAPNSYTRLIDNTASMTLTTPAGLADSAGSALCLTTKYGYVFLTGGTGYTLNSLDVSLNAAAGGPFVVDFLV